MINGGCMFSSVKFLLATPNSPASRGVAQSERRRTSFPFRCLHMRVFRKNFIVPYSEGPNALATPPPSWPSIRFLLLLLSLCFFYSPAKRRERKRRNFLRPEIFRGPHGRAWQRVLSAPSDLYVPRWKTWDELEMKESLSKHTLVCFLFLFSLLMAVKSDISALHFYFKTERAQE